MLKATRKKTLKISFIVIFSVLSLTFGFSLARAPPEDGVSCTVIEDLPNELILDKTYRMTVDCRNVGTTPYYVWVEITIYGSNEFTNNDIFINWVSYDENGKIVSNFTLGRNLWGWGAHMNFTQVDGNSIKWVSAPTRMNPGVYRRHTLYVSILGSAPLGNYRVVAVVLGEKPPVKAKVFITPQVLNVEGTGEWIQARIRLPTPYNVKDIDINSIKLWFKDRSIQIEWGHITGGYLLVKFSRDKVVRMLESEKGIVNLTVTGLVNGVEFYGTDTITIIAP
jgi:hypothetical protein